MKNTIKLVLTIFIVIIFFACPVFAKDKNIKILNMDNVIDGNCTIIKGTIKDSNGKKYRNALRFNDNNYIIYHLNGEFNTFVGTIITMTPNSSNMVFLADGKEIYSLIDFDRNQASKSVKLDVTGISILEIRATGEYIYLVDSYFKKNPDPKQFNEYKWNTLNEVTSIEREWSEADDHLYGPFLIYNNHIYLNAYHFSASYNGNATFALNQTYSSISGKIVPGINNYDSVSMTIKMYSDGKEIFSKSGITNQSEAIDFCLDVTQTNLLKIDTFVDDGYNGGEIQLVIVNDVLITKEKAMVKGTSYSNISSINEERIWSPLLWILYIVFMCSLPIIFSLVLLLVSGSSLGESISFVIEDMILPVISFGIYLLLKIFTLGLYDSDDIYNGSYIDDEENNSYAYDEFGWKHHITKGTLFDEYFDGSSIHYINPISLQDEEGNQYQKDTDGNYFIL